MIHNKSKIAITIVVLSLSCCVSIFSQDKRPRAVAVLFDNTGSMYFEIENIKNLGIGLVQKLDENDEVKMFSFAEVKDEKALTKITPAFDWTKDKEKIYPVISELKIARGKTTIFDGILVALQELTQKADTSNDTFSSKTLILFTDGNDRASKTKKEDIFRYAKEKNIKIYIFGFVELSRSRKKSERDLPDIADKSGGRVVFPEKKQLIGDLIKDLSPFERN